MKKVSIDDLSKYKFDTVFFDKRLGLKSDIVDSFEEKLESRISILSKRLKELQEVQELFNDINIIYLIKNNDSRYNYIDKQKNIYEYNTINEKPILISSDFKMYEIVEYCEVKDVNPTKHYSNSIIESWVDIVCKVKKL